MPVLLQHEGHIINKEITMKQLCLKKITIAHLESNGMQSVVGGASGNPECVVPTQPLHEPTFDSCHAGCGGTDGNTLNCGWKIYSKIIINGQGICN